MIALTEARLAPQMIASVLRAGAGAWPARDDCPD
jgi:hypothetical protein